MKHQTYNNFILSQSAFYLHKYFRHLNKFHEDNWKSTQMKIMFYFVRIISKVLQFVKKNISLKRGHKYQRYIQNDKSITN